MFSNRSAAGRTLARALRDRVADRPALVLALPPGGVVVAAQISAHLHLPLDVLLVRDLDVALVVEGDLVEIDREHAREIELSEERLAALVTYACADVRREVQVLRGRRPFPPVWGRVVVLVDDGCSSARALDAAVRYVRALGAARVVLAAPVVATALADGVAGIVDELVHLEAADQTDASYEDDRPLRDVDLVVQLTRAHQVA